jgi:hypothetical protein
MSPKAKHTYCLYVVELVPAVWRTQKRMREANPRYNPDTGKGYLYVGMTSATPAERLRTHKKGVLSSAAVVRDYGCALVPSLYETYARMTKEDAEEMEPYLAERLRKKGYAVWPIKPGGAFTMEGAEPPRRRGRRGR